MAAEIQKIKQDIALNRTVVFIGTGVSVCTTNNEEEAAHLNELLKVGLQECHQLGWSSDTDFEDFNHKLHSYTAKVDD